MKKLLYIFIPFILAISGSGCKKYLDVNKDPNNPLDVSPDLILAPVETEIATVVAGGSLSTNNQTGIAEVIAFFMRQISLNQTQPQIDGYKLRQDDVDPLWLYNYAYIMQNIHIMNNKAEANGLHAYGTVSKVLMAYMLGVTTDMWGDIPYKDAFDGNFKPVYQSQEEIYQTMDMLLDSAILEKGLDPGQLTPGADDFIYDGDLDKWVKFAYSLKARNAIHLTNAPGHDAVTQSNLALTDLQNAFASQDDEANFSKYSDAPATENPWFKNIAEDQGGVVLESNFIDSLVNRNDPRLPIIATKPNGVFLGRVNTTDPAPDFTIFSVINEFYAGAGAPQSIVNYSEMLFIKAEAIFRISGAAAATPIYQEAIKSHMSKLGLDVSSPEVTAYLASRGTLTDANAIQRIMEEKSIANFLSIENYNDWRRTGFPTVPPVPHPFINYVPLRFPYPLAEVISNKQPQQSLTTADPVWWDAN